MIFTSVDAPASFSPNNAWMEPPRIVIETSRKASTPGNAL
jgi:hypothetical protein